MKKMILLLFLVPTMIFAMGSGDEISEIKTNQDIAGKTIVLQAHVNVNPGPWKKPHTFGIITIDIVPQIAVWYEDLEGNYLGTLMITGKTARQNWDDPNYKNFDKPYRTESVPVWLARYGKNNNLPTKNNPLPDGITGASPRGHFTLTSNIPASGKVAIFVEINASHDENDVYNESEAGQPAIVYSAVVDLETGGEFPLTFIGRSSVDGSTGDIYTDTTGMTTALELVNKLKIVVE